MERTYVMLKPDAYQRKLLGKIISRIEEKGFRIVDMKMMQLNEEILREHYHHHIDKPFFKDLVDFMISGPVVGIIVEGESIIRAMRNLAGSTQWQEATPGTIRGDYAHNTTQNLIHCSDSVETATMEIKRFFG
ncbi:MAG: nucleoside-diphosphate kinase [Bacilli bacterium]|jgi:nucleoside-diphosphate kinase